MFVEIKKDRIYCKKERVDFIKPYLNDEVVDIEDGLTLGDFMGVLMEYEDEVNDAFIDVLRNHKIQPFYDDLSNSSEEGSTPKEIHICRFGRVTDRENDDLEMERTYSEMGEVLGVVEDRDERVGFMFAPLGNLKNAELVLDKHFKIWNGGEVELDCGRREYTLREMISIFLHEITFHGYPETREERRKELLKGVEEAENDIGEGRTFMQEEMRLSTEKRKLKRLLEKEDYEKANIVRDRIIKLEETILEQKGEINEPFSFLDDED